jgi:predicted Abi (CAAX) family protease
MDIDNWLVIVKVVAIYNSIAVSIGANRGFYCFYPQYIYLYIAIKPLLNKSLR